MSSKNNAKKATAKNFYNVTSTEELTAFYAEEARLLQLATAEPTLVKPAGIPATETGTTENPAEPTETANEAAFIPSPANAPEGMVWCKVCKRHVPKKYTYPTTEYGVAMCKAGQGCENVTSLQAAAKLASANVTQKPAKAAKTATERKTLFGTADVLTAIKPNPKKKGTKAEVGYDSYYEGMTVDAYLALAKENGFYGREALAYDHRHAFITIVTATEYAAILAERAELAEVKEA